MGRKRTGTKFFDPKTQRWFVVLTVDLRGGGKERRPIQLPEGIDETQAEKKRIDLAAKAKNRLFEPKEPVERPGAELTLESYATERWIKSRIARGLRSVRKDRERLKSHVFPVLGKKPMVAITTDDIRGLVEVLDRKIHDPEVRFSWKTAAKTWGAVTKLFSDAVKSKEAALRVLGVNPCADVEGPDSGSEKAKQWLYPTEFSALVACADVPLRWRCIYAVATYLLLRLSEVRALHIEDIDLRHGMVRVHRSTDERGTTVREFTKTASVRHFRIETELVPLLRVLIGDRTEGQLFGSVDDAAGELRDHLRRAGVKREALHRGTKTSLPMRFHDLRATGITWSALRGDRPVEIRDRAGHTELEQTNEYMRRASSVGNVGRPFPSLAVLYSPADIVRDCVSNSAAGNDSSLNQPWELCEGGDLKSREGTESQENQGDSGSEEVSGTHAEEPTDDIPDDSEVEDEAQFLAAIAESAERAQAVSAMRTPLTAEVGADGAGEGSQLNTNGGAS